MKLIDINGNIHRFREGIIINGYLGRKVKGKPRDMKIDHVDWVTKTITLVPIRKKSKTTKT